MIKDKVICVGEALVDRIVSQSDNKFTNYFGGAPANVACALSKLGISSTFIGRLGNDRFGIEFMQLLNKNKVNTNFLQVDTQHPTRIIKVLVDKDGDRSFSGFVNEHTKNFADEMLNKSNIVDSHHTLNQLFKDTKFIITGTIVLANPNSEESIHYLLEKAKKFNTKIVIDLNWREIFWDKLNFIGQSPTDELKERIVKFLEFADLLKLAREEAQCFFDTLDPCSISKSLPSSPDVVITNGNEEINWFIGKKQGRSSVPKTNSPIVDTTGAGDAFLAGLISQLVHQSELIQESQIADCIHFASTCGLLTCFSKGAIEAQPYLTAVRNYLSSR